jgi:hypothetical protein
VQTYWLRGYPRKITINGGISVRERSHDAAGNLTVFDDQLNNLYDLNMTYDGLSRFKIAHGVWGDGSVNYSNDDDITNKPMEINSFCDTYNSSKNRVASVSGLPNSIIAALRIFSNVNTD